MSGVASNEPAGSEPNSRARAEEIPAAPGWEIREGECVDVMAAMPEVSVDAIVCDPPYLIGFMGKEFDSQHRTFVERRSARRAGSFEAVHGNHNPIDSQDRQRTLLSEGRRAQSWHEQWAAEALRVLKPGGYLLAFGGTRTYHRLTCGLEDAGLEIRDCLVWLYGSGFPKGTGKHLIPAAWEGWNTALKPGHEPIVLARRPLIGTLAANLDRHGTGALNLAGCAIDIEDRERYERNHSGDRGHDGTRPLAERGATDLRMGGGSAAEARHPANVALDEDAAATLDEQTGVLVSGANPTRRGSDKFREVYGEFPGQEECEPRRGVDRGGASRFYYCAKASRAEREAGLDGFERKPVLWSNGDQNPGSFQSDGTDRTSLNPHPTVKPIELMRWLVRLVTPPGGVVLDPFAGSGTTGIAAMREGFSFLGIEREPEYVALARERIRQDAPLLNIAAEAVA